MYGGISYITDPINQIWYPSWGSFSRKGILAPARETLLGRGRSAFVPVGLAGGAVRSAHHVIRGITGVVEKAPALTVPFSDRPAPDIRSRTRGLP